MKSATLFLCRSLMAYAETLSIETHPKNTFLEFREKSSPVDHRPSSVPPNMGRTRNWSEYDTPQHEADEGFRGGWCSSSSILEKRNVSGCQWVSDSGAEVQASNHAARLPILQSVPPEAERLASPLALVPPSQQPAGGAPHDASRKKRPCKRQRQRFERQESDLYDIVIQGVTSARDAYAAKHLQEFVEIIGEKTITEMQSAMRASDKIKARVVARLVRHAFGICCRREQLEEAEKETWIWLGARDESEAIATFVSSVFKEQFPRERRSR